MLKIKLVCTCGQTEDLSGRQTGLEIRPTDRGIRISKECPECGLVSTADFEKETTINVKMST